MTVTRGRCHNVDYCELAAARCDIDVPLGQPFVCPECAADLAPPPTTPRLNRLRLEASGIALAAGLVCTGLGAGYLLFHPGAWLAGNLPPATSGPTLAANQPAGAAKPEGPAVLLRLEGSALLGSSLVPKLATAFLAAQGDTDVTTQPGAAPGETAITGLRAGHREAVVIAANGSNAAFAALSAGRANIGMSSRRLSAAELLRLHTSGAGGQATQNAVALAAPAVIVNPANPVTSLEVDTLLGVLDGNIRNWDALGGPDAPIHLLTSTEPAEASPGGAGANPAHLLADSVMKDPTAIAVVAVQRVGGAKILSIGAPGLQPSLPTEASVAGLTYPLAHALYLFTPAGAPIPITQLFMTYALSPEGQALVPQSGLVRMAATPAPAAVGTLTPTPASPKTPAPPPPAVTVALQVPQPIAAAATPPATRTTSPPATPPASQPPAPPPWTTYRSLAGTARLMAPGLHFDGNFNTLDPAGTRDLKRALGLIGAARTPSSHVILAAFAGGRATEDANLAASKAGAEAVAAMMTKQGIPPGQLLAMGSGSPASHVRGNKLWVEMYVLN